MLINDVYVLASPERGKGSSPPAVPPFPSPHLLGPRTRTGYHWDDYDMRGSRTLMGCADGATAAPPDLLMLSEGASLVPMDDMMEGLPLLPRPGYHTCTPMHIDAAATPLLYVDPRGVQEEPGYDDDDDGNADEPCSFEEILFANNISVDSCQDMGANHLSKYNIVSDLEDDCSETPLKISNVPSAAEGINKLGSPRSRRPFHRRDYSRVSDLSFLSALEEEGVDDSMSELQDSDYESVDITSNPQAATLVQTSLSEVFL
ncbi:hypothetical protein GWK47_039826 [Chionoecetes opilio]|uniref:Uncharacterized protein n=1 Tax=Chionoecetes opilio TaxID=41210 RepID=A0A8J5D161_CHIOP|nr:hypothetical protein GWK47_039826 [Chionoecetes opilio]